MARAGGQSEALARPEGHQTEQGRTSVGKVLSRGPDQCCAEAQRASPFFKWDPSESLFHPPAPTPRCERRMDFCKDHFVKPQEVAGIVAFDDIA